MVAQSYRWAEVYIHPPTLSINASNQLRTHNIGMLVKGAKIKGREYEHWNGARGTGKWGISLGTENKTDGPSERWCFNRAGSVGTHNRNTILLAIPALSIYHHAEISIVNSLCCLSSILVIRKWNNAFRHKMEEENLLDWRGVVRDTCLEIVYTAKIFF